MAYEHPTRVGASRPNRRDLLTTTMLLGTGLLSGCTTVAAGGVEQIEHRGHDQAAEHDADDQRSEEHTSELQSLMRISYAVFCLKKKTPPHTPFNVSHLIFIYTYLTLTPITRPQL